MKNLNKKPIIWCLVALGIAFFVLVYIFFLATGSPWASFLYALGMTVAIALVGLGFMVFAVWALARKRNRRSDNVQS